MVRRDVVFFKVACISNICWVAEAFTASPFPMRFIDARIALTVATSHCYRLSDAMRLPSLEPEDKVQLQTVFTEK
jgi:hypothetical protein